jgi:hypothetical protein
VSGLAIIADHWERTLELVPRWFRSKPAYMALLKVVADAMQTMETDRFDAYIGQMLEFATGPTLDLWGWVFGAGPRGGLPPTWYRRLIRVAIATKYSNGNTESLVRRWGLATAPSTVELYRATRKGVSLVCFRADWMPEAYAARVAAIVRLGGPVTTIMLFEALETYLGNSSRTEAPAPTPDTNTAPGAKVW